ncbi:hypothetical protein BGY98DRAFT_376641 [Russula aff. rugulosa BPL654]|nr:hypothetical protein BGY98DRAFT_376641 [Russula aff. rugulosa BPL654]
MSCMIAQLRVAHSLALASTTHSCAWPGGAGAHSGGSKLPSPRYRYPLARTGASRCKHKRGASQPHTNTTVRSGCVLPGVLPAHIWSSSDASCGQPRT